MRIEVLLTKLTRFWSISEKMHFTTTFLNGVSNPSLNPWKCHNEGVACVKSSQTQKQNHERVLRHRQINEGRKVSFVAIITPTQWTLLRWSTQRICHPDSPYLFGKWWFVLLGNFWSFVHQNEKKSSREWRESYSAPPKVQKRGVDGTTRAKALTRDPHHTWAGLPFQGWFFSCPQRSKQRSI